MILRGTPVLALIVALAVPAAAQVGLNGIKAGLGTMTLGPVNTNALNGGNGELGIQYYPPTGNFYVTRRGTNALTTAPHSILIIDQSGALVGTVQQGPGATGGAWGHRDGATDAYAGGTKLFFGDEFGIHCYEMSLGLPVYVTGAQTVMATNGPQTCTFPLAVQGGTGTITRALEYNPNGNAGNGSFWAGDFSAYLVEFSLAGMAIAALSLSNSPPTQPYGLAMNLGNGMLWLNGSGFPGTIRDIAELDPANGIFTGRRFRPAGTTGTGSSPWVYGAQGGLCYVQGRSGPTFGPAAAPPYSELAALTQGTPDHYALYRLDLELGFPSELETKVEVSLNAGTFSSATATWTAGTTLSIRYNTPIANPGSGALLLANVGAPATPIPAGNTVNVAELLILNNLSTSAALASGVTAVTLGDAFALGGLLAPDVLIISPFTQPPLPSPPVALPTLGGPGTQLSLQAIYFSYAFNPVATNFVVLTEM